jgi:hypothetical protein
VGSRSRSVCSGLCRRSGSRRFRGTGALEMKNPAEVLGRGDLGGVLAFGATGRQASNAADQWWFQEKRTGYSGHLSGGAKVNDDAAAARHFADERGQTRPASAPAWCCTSTTPNIFSAGIKGRARIQPEAARTLALLMALGELHGRNLASAFMRSRVHNRTRDRGGKPIRLGVAVGIAPGPSGGTEGALSKKSPTNSMQSFFAICEYTA